MVSERRLLELAVLKMWTPRQGSPRNLGLAVAQLSLRLNEPSDSFIGGSDSLGDFVRRKCSHQSSCSRYSGEVR